MSQQQHPAIGAAWVVVLQQHDGMSGPTAHTDAHARLIGIAAITNAHKTETRIRDFFIIVPAATIYPFDIYIDIETMVRRYFTGLAGIFLSSTGVEGLVLNWC